MISAPDRKKAIELINIAMDSGARLEPACDVVGITPRTYQRWTKGPEIAYDKRPTAKRPTPKNKLSEEEKKEILKVINNKDYADLAPSKIVPKLADEGTYLASESTIYRILREMNQNTHRLKSKEAVRREPATHVATDTNQVWTWDITWLNGPAKGTYFKLYLVIDIFSRFIVGSEVWETENAAYSETLIKRALLSQNIAGKPLILHSDNGSPMKAATFLTTLERLGVQSSFSRPRVSNDNPYSEALFKTMKYLPEYPNNGFATLEEARKWANKFVNWYNKEHLHSGISYITPYQRHHGLGEKILENRKQVYAQAKLKHPERWSREIRDWSLPEYVSLNPIKEEELVQINKAE